MTRTRLALSLLIAVAILAVATPARAGLLGSVLGPVAGPGAGAEGADWTLGGRPCSLIEVPSAGPLGVSSCPGVRPGSIVQTDTGTCSLNFMFTDPSGDRFMGTAGHCLLATSPLGGGGNVGEVTFAEGEGPEARDSRGDRIGEFAYAVLQDPKDFALIRLDDGVEASPQVCTFGGPTGINDTQPGLLEPTTLTSFGNPLGLGTGITAKTFVALGMPSSDHVFATGLVLPGDSGGPVLDSAGRAIGVVVTTGLHPPSDLSSLLALDGLDAGLVGITRITPQIERAGQALGTQFEIVTAPTL